MLFISMMACSSNKLSMQAQGIKGVVLWFEGNQMPGFDREPDPGKGIAREIHVYELTRADQSTIAEFFHNNISTKLITIGKSNDEGQFEIQLAPGTYSIFIKEEAGLFANVFDMNQHINPVKVEAGSFTELIIHVNNAAAY